VSTLRDGTRFGLGLLLTAVAGWVDAIGFLSIGGFYVSFMSGNTTQLGIALSKFDLDPIRTPLSLLGCFLLGAFFGTIISSLCGRWGLPVILLAEGVLLGSGLMLSIVHLPVVGAAEPLAVSMGAQNAALRSERGHRIGGTFVTGTVFGMGEALALYCLGRQGPRAIYKPALSWAALATGAAFGTLAYALRGLLALAVPAGCLLTLAMATALVALRTSARPVAKQGTDLPV
jgi:uncharacterized membrane protein YoaK (UPF0700 family)